MIYLKRFIAAVTALIAIALTLVTFPFTSVYFIVTGKDLTKELIK